MNFKFAKRYSSIRPEIRRAERLGHSFTDIVTRERPGLIVAKSKCEGCGGHLIIERVRGSDDPDALTVTGDVLAMECA